ncbi:MAG: hypothetical protein JST00_31310 [Deltaproteobacteria bacterium]|nr:hypothetical protein [Deltaproteobacteria bacterium]
MGHVEGTALVLRRGWAAPAVCAAMVVVGVVWSRASFIYAPFGWFCVFFGGLFGPLCVARNAFPRSTPATFRASSEGISIAGIGDLSSEDIVECKIVPRGGSSVVELTLRSRPPVTLRVDVSTARAIAQVLGARRSQFRLIVPLGKRFLFTSLIFTALAVALFSPSPEGLLLAAINGPFYGLLVALLLGLYRGRLVIGADGFTINWRIWKRFVPFRDVASVTGRGRFLDRSVEDTMIELGNGKKVRLRTVEAPNTEEERGAEGRAMLTHAQAAFENASRLAAGAVDVASLVQRNARTPREWLSGIDALVRGGGSRYRVAAVTPEMLADLVADASASADARVGAAAALARIGDGSMRSRVRIAAEACAQAEVRAALIDLADAHDDAAVEEGLAKLRAEG